MVIEFLKILVAQLIFPAEAFPQTELHVMYIRNGYFNNKKHGFWCNLGMK